MDIHNFIGEITYLSNEYEKWSGRLHLALTLLLI
jgi:hypothetical protein